MARQSEVHKTAGHQQDEGQVAEKSHCPDSTRLEERGEPYGYAFREEWLRRWGFPPEDHKYTEDALYGLSGDLNKHMPRISDDCLEPLACDDSWGSLTPRQKLFLVLEFHLRVAPYIWWRDYFVRLDRNAI